jgi:formylglycine-generating enzyme required for sulfatase activity
MSKADSPKRIAFVSNSLTGAELTGGNRDTSLVYSLLTDPNLGACSIDSPPPMHQCDSRLVFEQALSGLFEHWNITDQLIFYFSGHGEIRGGKYCLKFGISKKDFLPFDNIINELNSWGVTRAIIILDTCFSGDATGVKTDDILQQTINHQQPPKGIAILASSRPGELSRELSDGSSSVFTHLLCEGLRTGLKNKPTVDGFITISDIVEFIADQLETDRKFSEATQRPSYSVTSADRSIWISKNITGTSSDKVRESPPLITTAEELKFLYETTQPDRHPCLDASLNELDWELISKFFIRYFSKSPESISREGILTQLHLYSPISLQGKHYLHKSAVLCFSQIPSLYYPEAKSTFIVGNLDDKQFIRDDVDGPLSKQVERLVEKTMGHLEIISNIGKSGLREEEPEIDESLVRELISNAIAHRDYDLTGNVTVVVKPDALEVKNPGKFPDDFSWSVVLEKKFFGSRPINVAISHYLSHLLVFEGIGRGLAIIKKYIEVNGIDSIKFTEFPGPITCISVLRRKKSQLVQVQGDMISAGQYNISHIIQVPAFIPPPDLDQLRQDYLLHIGNTYRPLDFKGMPQLQSYSREIALDDIYVPLLARPELPEGETWERRLAGRDIDAVLPQGNQDITELNAFVTPVPIEEALRMKSQVIVLGDPGSGKSTMLKYLALRLAQEPNAPLPILLPLNAYAHALSKNDINLQAYLSEYYAGRAQGLSSLGPLFNQAIYSGQAVILLDGLDEVQGSRSLIVQKIEDFSHDTSAKGNKIVVTSRIVGYRSAPLNSNNWALYTLLDFNNQAIESFVEKWCFAFEKSTLGDTPEAVSAAEMERTSLLEAISANPGVAHLASNPLLLTILALIKRQGVNLPKHRVQLYDLYLETLIRSWNKARSLDRRPFGPGLETHEILMTLGPLALWLREENPTAGIVSESALINQLTKYYMGDDWGLKRGDAGQKANEFIQSVRRYSNLLIERGEGLYGFLHLTFEEMLAAYGLISLGQLDIQKSIAFIKKHLFDPAWRETILLSVGITGLVQRQPLVAGELVRSILHVDNDNNAGENILLAGACLEDVGEIGLGRAVATEIQSTLLSATEQRSFSPIVQRDAGFSLARTGWVPPDLDSWISIPSGEFLYGNDKRKVVIEQPFMIAKYPVTNLQFGRFIASAGYEKREFWSAEGWEWRTGQFTTKASDLLKDMLKERSPERRHEPFYWHDSRWNNPLAPVVGISWFEADAYANWLSAQMGQPVKLPTEQEWERAARGVDGREYPWGDKFNRNNLNCAEFWSGRDDLRDVVEWRKWFSRDENIASTTVVGQFPSGQTDTGICDMSGCVWEWTGSWFEENMINRVVRGGAWPNNYVDARCSSRNGHFPDLFSLNVGFRLLKRTVTE